MSLNDTPRANRLHIGIFGKRNNGKSSLINAITGSDTALVSEHAGTTADPVYKTMEIHGIGPVVLIDTAGLDDTGALGELRVERTRDALNRADIALFVFTAPPDIELAWIKDCKAAVIPVINKTDVLGDVSGLARQIRKATGLEPVAVCTKEKKGNSDLIRAIIRALPEDYEAQSLTGELAKAGDVVLLVMPQDIQAPKGRLILPQVQTLRELLDKKCIVVSCVGDMLESALSAIPPPRLIITDSQIFPQVYEKKPKESLLTSFSVLMAASKGDIAQFIEGTKAIDTLHQNSRVLIAEACTHAPLSEDIGREKIPSLLRKRFGEKIVIDIASGSDFPADVSGYDLIIHCGACMFNRRYVLSRMEQARSRGVPICNYGTFLAYMSGILDKIAYYGNAKE